jgi:superfamily I DNA/RNA helicase
MKKRRRIVREVWQETLQNTSITESMLLGEIDWLKDQLPMTRKAYLSASRRGRGFALNVERRKQVWGAMKKYQETLQANGDLDWGDVPRRLWKFVQDKTVDLPKYDFIMVDEAQFFAPLWFRIIQEVLRSENAHLFLVADPTQGFLGRRTTWKSLGMEARGRSHQLKHSYRTTREIMHFATMFYRLRLRNEKDEEILVPDMLNMPNGVFPQIIALSSAQDEIARVANEVAEFLKQGCLRKHLLLLHANGSGVQMLVEAINQRMGNDVAMDPKKTYPGNYVRVTTLNAGAGLESPIVFLVGLRELFDEQKAALN